MKKLLFLALIAVFAIGCEGPEGPMGPAGENGTSNWYIQFYVVGEHSEDYPYGYWESLGNGKYQCVFQISSLTNFIYNEGIVNAFYMQDFDTDYEVQIGLPHIFFGSDENGDYTATYTFDTTPGSVAFNVAYSDFNDATPPPCVFRVAMIW